MNVGSSPPSNISGNWLKIHPPMVKPLLPPFVSSCTAASLGGSLGAGSLGPRTWTWRRWTWRFLWGIPGSSNGGTDCTICLAILLVYPLNHSRYIGRHIGLIYGRYLQFRFLKRPTKRNRLKLATGLILTLVLHPLRRCFRPKKNNSKDSLRRCLEL